MKKEKKQKAAPAAPPTTPAEEIYISPFTTMERGTIVQYRNHPNEGARHGKFRSFARGRVELETIPGYKGAAEILNLSEDLVELYVRENQPPVVARLAAEAKPKSASTGQPEGWRTTAAKKAWETIRAKRAAASSVA